ncbi:MAG: hypothetical protein LBE81_09985 [Azonexus sp.]|jgi:hypothetical protein|uniref:hypothetical protein n=1 Tax=Azonexus sp. TaxID=1872668 RepID=UPI0028349D99|nr:hypothetical protein [Azonexus sp.]MDR0776947.1 hypothetical protein [Azonexus sp.]
MHAAQFLRLTVVAVAWIHLGMAPATAQNVLGFDDMSCTAWGAAKNDPDQRAAHVAWIRGFLSGHNYAQPKQQVSVISSGTIENFINRYCASNPKGNFADGAMRLSDQFSGRNQPIRK